MTRWRFHPVTLVATDPRCFELRSIVIATIPGVLEDKGRRCVVLRVDGDYVEVAYGQSSASSTPSQDIVVRYQ